MNKPIQVAEVQTRALPKFADTGSRQPADAESPFSELLASPVAATPLATASPGKAGAEDAKPEAAPGLAGVKLEPQASIQVLVQQELTGEAVTAVSLPAGAVESLQAGIQLLQPEPASPEPVIQPTGVAPADSKAVQLRGVTTRDAALLLAAGPVPVAQAAQQAQLAGLARAQRARLPDAGVQQPAHATTEVLARNADTAEFLELPKADFNPAARKGPGMALLVGPDNGAAGRREKPGSELMQLIAGGRSLLPDGPAATTQSQTLVNIPATAETVPDFQLTPSAIRGQIPTLVGQAGWDRAVGEQALWFISQNIKAASLRLNPAHLGPMEMMVTVDGDKANVAFASGNAIVREALESAVPRLREMLAENGLNLANVNVSHQGLSDQRGHRTFGSQLPLDGSTADTSVGDPGSEHAVSTGIRTPLGLVDYYV
jgi:hypothetical protein